VRTTGREKRALTPLFDRLTDLKKSEPAEKEVARALTLPDLVDSVAAEVSRIVNTRSHRRGSSGFDIGTVLDFGIPDFAPFVPSSGDDLVRLEESIAAKIRAGEPRLRNVRVSLQYEKKSPVRLVGAITGSVQVGGIIEPVSFDLSSSATRTLTERSARTGEEQVVVRVRSAGSS
jgi:type VI secretion system protein ImpF